MIVLTNPKHEAYAQARAAGERSCDAAVIAGFAHSRRYATGTELERRSEIKERIAELRQTVAAQNTVSFSYSLIDAMKRAALAFDVAQKRKNGAAMVAAVSLEAKLCGLLVDKVQEIKGLEELSDSEIDKLMASFETRRAVHVAGAKDDNESQNQEVNADSTVLDESVSVTGTP